MNWFRTKTKVTLDSLFDDYAAVLARGPRRGGTVHSVDELPADKGLMKAVLLGKAFELGAQSNEILEAGFISLANFQVDDSEPAERHLQIAAEMSALALEWKSRVRFKSEETHA